jgi:hypothetical protein
VVVDFRNYPGENEAILLDCTIYRGAATARQTNENPPPVLPDESSVLPKNIVLSELSKLCFNENIPRSPRRRFAVVTKRGAGCDGRGRAARRAAHLRTVKPCGPVPSTLGSSCAAICAATVTESPTHRGERGVSRKAIAQGVPIVSANLW